MMINNLNKDKLYYFASPYSNDNEFIRRIRYEATICAASRLTSQGFRLLEPIAMCHEQTERYSMPTGYEFWKSRDRGFVKLADELIVLGLPGWRQSVGVSDEVEYAKSLGKPVHIISVYDVFTRDEVHCIDPNQWTPREEEL